MKTIEVLGLAIFAGLPLTVAIFVVSILKIMLGE